jgi:hemerythrin-like domain-containing protein
MSDALQLLTSEHRTFSELLSLIDQQSRNLKAGFPVDFELLRNVLEYFNGYPDECHHPVEDVVFGRLAIRNPVAVSDLDQLTEEHEELERLTDLLSEAIESAMSSGDVATEELRAVMQRFVDNYRHHMEVEEERFFSVANQVLTQDDWDEIDFIIFERDDPLFDSAVHIHFRKLQQKIGASASKSLRREYQLKQLKSVEQLKSMSDFNKLMHKRGYSLVHRANGGYMVESDGQTIIDIPECGETRAVWCAYYYLRGRARGAGGV